MSYIIKSLDPKTGHRRVRFRAKTYQEAYMWFRWIKRFEPMTYPSIHRYPHGPRQKKVRSIKN